jgi:hypothetical protein
MDYISKTQNSVSLIEKQEIDNNSNDAKYLLESEDASPSFSSAVNTLAFWAVTI